MIMAPRHTDVLIIGAGAAGLSCAQALRRNSTLSCIVVEASERIGGRIAQDLEFLSGAPTELGAQFVHGENTLLTRLAKNHGWPLREVFTHAQGDGGPMEIPAPDGGVGYYFLGSSGRLLRYDDADPEFVKVNRLLNDLDEFNVKQLSDRDMSIQDYLRCQGVTEEMIALADAGYGNTAGMAISQLSVAAAALYDFAWAEEGTCDSIMEQSFKPLMDYLKREVEVLLRWAVTRVCYHGAGVRVTNSDGEVIQAKAVVITASIGALQAGIVEFVPPLPSFKATAIAKRRMDPCLKMFFLFERRFWPEDMHGIICAGERCFIPEFFGDGREHKHDSRSVYKLVGFATTRFAEAILYCEERTIIERTLQQLDYMFGTEGDRSPASTSFVKYMAKNWSEDPYVRGGYCAPTAEVSDIIHLRTPLDGKVFFAGEASQFPGMTVHAAIESGLRSAGEIMVKDTFERISKTPMALEDDVRARL